VRFAIAGYRLKVGDRVIGNYSKKEIAGVILEHPKRKGQPFVFSTRRALLCYIDTGTHKVAVTNIRRAGKEWDGGELQSRQLTLDLTDQK